MRFEAQTITVRDTLHRTYQIEAHVALHDDGTSVGLAVHPAYRLGPGLTDPHTDGESTVTHLASGVRLLGENAATIEAAYTWLERVAPLTDWTQPAEVLRADATLRLRVRLAWVRVQYWDDDDEHILFDTDAEVADTLPPPSASLTLPSLTTFLEWVIVAMEREEFKPEAQPTLDTLLLVHSQLAPTGRVSSPTVL